MEMKLCQYFCAGLFMKFTTFHLLAIYSYRNTTKGGKIKPSQISTQIDFIVISQVNNVLKGLNSRGKRMGVNIFK